MSYFYDAQIVFDRALNELHESLPSSVSVDIAWESVAYTPTRGTPFLRPTLLFSPATNLNLAGLKQEMQGIYQIDLFYPSEKGPKELRKMMDRLLDHFKTSLKLSQGSLDFHILNVTGLNPGLKEDIWYRGIIEVNFVVHN